MNAKTLAVNFVISLVFVGGLCFYVGTVMEDDGPSEEGFKPGMRSVRIGDVVGMICSFPGTSNDAVYAEVSVVAYRADNYVVSVIAEGNTSGKTIPKEDFTWDYPDEDKSYFGQDTIITAFGEIECEVYSIHHQGNAMRVWYHDGIGLKKVTTIDGTKTVMERVSISFVTNIA